MEYRGEGEVRAVLPGPPLKKGYQTNLDIRLDPDVAKQQGRFTIAPPTVGACRREANNEKPAERASLFGSLKPGP